MATLSLYAIPAYADPLATALSLSSTEVGALSSSLAISYAAMQVPAGIIGATLGIRRAFVLGLGLVAAGFAGSAMTASFFVLLAFRCLTGAGAGMLIPLGSSLARNVFPNQNMRAQGALGTGWGLGYILSLLVLPSIFSTWREAFVGLGVCAIALSAVALAIIPPIQHGMPSPVLREVTLGLRQSVLWMLGLCLFGLTLSIVGIGSWVTVFAHDQRQLSTTSAGDLASLIGVGLLPASLAGAIVARRVGAFAVIRASCIGLIVSIMLIATPLTAPFLALGLLGLGWFSALPFGVILALAGKVGEQSGSATQGARVGAVNGIAFVGGVIAPPLVGAIRDMTGSFGIGFFVLLIGPIIALLSAATIRDSPALHTMGIR
jgi:predicted MFS family arabinose efflux permease